MQPALQQGFFRGYLEVLGAELLHEAVGEESFSLILEKKEGSFDEPFDAQFFVFFDEALQKRYGIVASRGIARLAGRLAFKVYKDGIPIFVERGTVENRLLPFVEKITAVLQDLIRLLKEDALADLVTRHITQDDAWAVEGTIRLPNGRFLQVGDQQFFMGMLESMLEWMDSRHMFQVSRKTDSAEFQSDEINLLVSGKRFD